MVESVDSSDVPRQKTLRLSKSKFLSGLQCHKRLYLEIHQPHLATPPDAGTQAMLDMGTEIGELARQRCPGGRLVTAGYRQTEAALAETARLIDDPSVPSIFEGAFLADGTLIRVDILERAATDDGRTAWRLIEVKSSTKVKDVHLNDLAIQHHVLLGAGLSVVGVGLMHINTNYVYPGGAIDLAQLFVIEDLSETISSRRAAVPQLVSAMHALMREPAPPVIEPGGHCHQPYECPFWAHCTQEKPARWIHYLPGSKQVVSRLETEGITTIDDIPEGTTLTAVQKKVKDNVEWVSTKLSQSLRSIVYPVHHLDFETVMLAVPRFPGTRPYQALPVQWSNHIEQEDGALRHEEFLHVESSDPRQVLAEALIESLRDRGSICVYSPYERSIIEQLAAAFPSYRQALMAIAKRLWDLHPIVRDHYYHPRFGGSYSLKEVLPALAPVLSYEDLGIKEGGQAASAYYRMVFVETDWIERAKIQEALLAYCKRDTLAMVELRRALAAKVLTT